MVVGRDADQLTRFYGEVQKRITDHFKRLLGKRPLSLWEGEPSVILIADFEAALNRIAYYYVNPAIANLTDRIEDYPGFSSFHIFRSALSQMDYAWSENVPWVRCPSIPKAPWRHLSVRQDERIANKLEEGNKIIEDLIIQPHLWLSCFNAESPQTISEASVRIVEKVSRHCSQPGRAVSNGG